jgi:hypothetical protein
MAAMSSLGFSGVLVVQVGATVQFHVGHLFIDASDMPARRSVPWRGSRFPTPKPQFAASGGMVNQLDSNGARKTKCADRESNRKAPDQSFRP